MALPLLEVAATVLRRHNGHILLAERRRDQIAGGYWELPGGKIEPGETPADAAKRELAEETGVAAGRLRLGPVHDYDFPTRRIRLHIFFADEWSGEPQGRERQRVAWYDPENPIGPVLPSNERILAALSLPSVYAVVSAGSREGPASVLDRCRAAFANGTRAIQLRAPHLTPDQRVALARRVSQMADDFGARMLLVGTAIEARRAGACGVHSTASQLRHLHERPQAQLWSASCHDERDVARAVELGADFIVLSPVLASASHPDLVPIGWQRFNAMAGAAPVPVFAQGGMTPERLDEALLAGAAGISVSVASTADGMEKAA